MINYEQKYNQLIAAIKEIAERKPINGKWWGQPDCYDFSTNLELWTDGEDCGKVNCARNILNDIGESYDCPVNEEEVIYPLSGSVEISEQNESTVVIIE